MSLKPAIAWLVSACLIWGSMAPIPAWAACMAAPVARGASLENPYTYSGDCSAKAFVEADPALKAHPLVRQWLDSAENDPDPGSREASRRQLAQWAYPIALALGKLDSGGAAPAFFRPRLEQTPPDYQGIVRDFPSFKVFFCGPEGSLPDPARSAEKSRESDRIGGFMQAQAAALGAAKLDKSLEYACSYVQPGYRLEDVQGDTSLAVYTKAIPKVLLKVMVGAQRTPLNPASAPHIDLNPVVAPTPAPAEALEPEDELPSEAREKRRVERLNKKLVLEGRKNPLKVPAMAKMFTQVIAEEDAKGLAPSYGAPHRWSPEFLASQGLLRLPTSKLLTALASGVTSRFLVTDRELPLLTYILSRPDDSITIPEMFRKSYQLNGGDVYLALLTVENVLSQYWRTPNRENRAVTRKLTAITNNYGGPGDRFGAWYHLFGIMLYGYVAGGTKARVVAKTETLGSHVLSRQEDEAQEDHINSRGAALGGELRKVVREAKHRDFSPGGMDYTDPKVHLDLSEDFRDRLHIVPSRDIEATLRHDSLWLKSLESDYAHCRVEVMPDIGWGVRSEYKVVREDVTLPKGKARLVLSPDARALRARVFLSGCEGGREAALDVEDLWKVNGQDRGH